MSKPSNLRDLCDEVAGLPGQSETNRVESSTYSRSPSTCNPVKWSSFTCTCRRRRRYQRRQVQLGPIELYDELSLTQEHFLNCRFFQVVTDRRRRSLGFKYTGLTGLLNRAVAMAFSMSSGAGGFSINPSLTYYATVNEGTAPAFQLVHILGLVLRCNIQSDYLTEFVEHILTKIMKLIQDREASPTDVSSDDRTLLLYAAVWQV